MSLDAVLCVDIVVVILRFASVLWYILLIRLGLWIWGDLWMIIERGVEQACRIIGSCVCMVGMC